MCRNLHAWWDKYVCQAAASRDLITYLRQMTVMYNAGIPVTRSFYIISNQVSSLKLKEVFQSVQKKIEAGSTLSASLCEFPAVFPELYTRLIAVGEKTGKLATVLENVADHAEKAHAQVLKLRSAIAYPAFVMIICLVFLVVGPAFFLKGMCDFLTSLSIPLPFSTRMLIEVSLFIRSPLFFISILAALALGYSSMTRVWQDTFYRSYFQEFLLIIPGIGRFYRTTQLIYFIRALAISCDSGISLIEGLDLARRRITLIKLASEVSAVTERLIAGSTLKEAFNASDFFPPLMLQFISAGEESGELVKMLDWSAWMLEQNNEVTLNIILETIQPFVMLVIGIIIGFLIIATMAPMMGVIREIS